MPLRILVLGESPGGIRRVLRRAVEQLRATARSTRAERVLVADPDTRQRLSPVGLACLAGDGMLSVRIQAVVDLGRSEADIRSDVRDSYRSLMNWGVRELSLTYCNGENPDRALFDAYKELHAQVAGRSTRPQASWDVMFATIESGLGELSLSSFDGALVGGMVVVDGSVSCYYASAAYVREQFEHPLAHWPMMDAILRARERGIRFFDIGEIPPPGAVSEKEASVGFFKKGFTSRIEVRPVWEFASGSDDREGD